MILAQDDTWKDIWFRCALAGDRDPDAEGFANQILVGFPDEQIALIYQTQDHDSLPPRTHLLVERVFQRFRQWHITENAEPPTRTEIAGAFRLLEAVYEKKGHLLSALDQGRLLGAMGMLCRNHSEDASPQMRKFWQDVGCKALKEAVALGDSIPIGLRRHLHWLTADTLIGAVRDDGAIRSSVNEKEVLMHLIEACRGRVSDATRGLYFSCISRLFTMSEGCRMQFCRELIAELRRAWTSLRAASLKREAKTEFVTLPFDELRVRCAEMLDWHAEDRFAVCTLLAWYEYRRAIEDRSRVQLSRVYSFEAAALRDHLSPHRITRATEPDVEIHSVKNLLRTAEGMRRVTISELPSASVANIGNQQAMNLIAKGHVRGAVKLLIEESEDSRCSLRRGLCRLKTAELWGDADDARMEREIIARVLRVHSSDEQRNDAIVRAEAYRLWARNAANSDCPDEVEDLILRAQESAGASASPHVAFIVERYRVIHSLETGTPLLDWAFMGQLTWASCLWNESKWIEGDYAANLQGFSRRTQHANRPDDTGPRAFKRWVHDLGSSPRPDDVLELTRVAFDVRLGELLGPWVSGLVNLYLGWVLSHRFPNGLRSQAFAPMDSNISNLVEMVVTRLRGGRQNDHRERLAMVLCQWLCYRGGHNEMRLPVHGCRSLVIPAVECAIAIARNRIARMRTEAQKNACRKRLRLIVATASEAGLLPLLQGKLTGILNDCKTNNADPWYLENASGEVPEDFDDTSAVAVNADDESEGLTHQHSNAHSSAAVLPHKRAVLSYFFPGSHDNKNDNGAFAVLRLNDANDGNDPLVTAEHCGSGTGTEPFAKPFAVVSKGAMELIFELPSAHEVIRTFRKTVKQAVRLYRSSLPGAQAEDAAMADNQEVSLPRLMSDLKRPLTPAARSMGNTDELNQKLDAAEGILAALGAALLPEALLHSLKGIEHLHIVPDGRLFLLPLHALPVSTNGTTLLDLGFAVSYKPRADYCPVISGEPPPRQQFICANIEDTGFAMGVGFKTWAASLGPRNAWSVQTCADDRLREISKTGRSVVVAHGHARSGQELLSRIALKDGQCITALDVNLSRYDYRRSQIFLFSCHSMPQRASIARELLGLGGTFLSRGVACVAASIWECEVDDVAALAAAICAAPPELQSVPQVWCETLRALGSVSSSPLEKFSRVGCFMLYMGD